MSEDLRKALELCVDIIDDFVGHLSPEEQEADPDVGEALTLARAALTLSRDGWRTFESAPKDGSYILAVVAPGRGRHLEYHAGRVFVIRYEGLTMTDHMGWAVYPGFGGASDHDFAYWQPIFPPPPVKEMGL
jgi:hypothetical protein